MVSNKIFSSCINTLFLKKFVIIQLKSVPLQVLSAQIQKFQLYKNIMSYEQTALTYLIQFHLQIYPYYKHIP